MIDHDIKELIHVPQELLTDPFTRRIDTQLYRRRRKQNCRRKHTDTDRLPKPPWRTDQHLGRQVLPAVGLQHLRVVAGEAAGWLGLPKCPRAGFLYLRSTDSQCQDVIPATKPRGVVANG